MAILISIGLGLLLARIYYYSGLFPAAQTGISVVLASAAGIGFGPVLAGLLEWDSSYRHATMLFAVGAISFGIIRVVVSPLDLEVDFPLWVERIGGGLVGLGSGLVIGGFSAICLLSVDSPAINKFSENMHSASAMAMGPSRLIARLIPGEFPLEIETVLSGNPPPPPPLVVEDEVGDRREREDERPGPPTSDADGQ